MFSERTNRRRFLYTSGGGGLAIGIGSSLPSCFLHAAESATGDEDRILVVVQLSGGNDGLNTVIPYADDAYRAARATLAVPRSEVLAIDDDLGFHPSLRGIKDLLDDGQVAVVQGVGYENPNRSHFESMDIWHSCVRKDQSRTDGWIGRALEQFTAADGGDVPALHLGEQQQPFALASETIRVPTVKQLEAFQLRGADSPALRRLLNGPPTPAADQAGGDLLGFLQSSTQGAISASQRVTAAAEGYQTDIKYPQSRLADQLRLVAQLISAEMTTRVYYLQLDGFDTHAQQGDTHAILLRQWSDAVAAFLRDMKAHGHTDRVCVMTFSEFGRRVAENASAGTDHGAAGPMFLCGGGLNAGLIGTAPRLDDLQQGDLKHSVDFRSVYASVLKDWLGTDPDRVLRGHYETLPLFAGA
ncbi:hypothetical protein Enr13x_76280 [Stieleria neptunia]|uniref:DUF1501 domain-containing protein n=1 Tax=Stieleria neptunia TaxID=2527979 RepID=A0A518I3V1_9BACT|nr:DUF1501 domain-containing protein [Stieleria neptunia]QDV47717.1 hypothetical protein Enr13x_76280 [Stieleria neptunia]